MPRYTEEEARQAVAEPSSYAEALRKRVPHPERRKVERPPYFQLLREVEELGHAPLDVNTWSRTMPSVSGCGNASRRALSDNGRQRDDVHKG